MNLFASERRREVFLPRLPGTVPERVRLPEAQAYEAFGDGRPYDVLGLRGELQVLRGFIAASAQVPRLGPQTGVTLLY